MSFDDDTDAFSPASGKYANRTRARVAAFQVLYRQELNPASPDEDSSWVDGFLEKELPRHDEILRFARSIIEGVHKNREEIDGMISRQSKNWTLARMSVTDRNILRQSLCELLYLDTPKAVVISEAVELAKNFGTNDSASFVNAILDKFDKK